MFFFLVMLRVRLWFVFCMINVIFVLVLFVDCFTRSPLVLLLFVALGKFQDASDEEIRFAVLLVDSSALARS